MTADLLLEIGTEDLPARFVLPLANALALGISQGLSQRGLSFDAVQRFATPRRLAVLITSLASEQPEQCVDLAGPALAVAIKDGQPTPAALGFAKKCGVAFAELGQKDGKLHFQRREAGKPTAELLPTIFEEALKQMDALVPKRMRWGDSEETFVRPVQWLLCLYGDRIVPLHRFGLTADRVTYGHRFHAPAAITLSAPNDYAASLRKASVWPDFNERKAEIRQQIETLGQRLRGHVRIDESLLEEVTALVERPVAISGQFEARFLELPPEVIVATVETNQRYFTVFEDAPLTRLTQHFITVSNIESRDVQQVISGNERVVRPRLTDALFFWQQDKKRPLSAYREPLRTTTYHASLGTVDAKVQRVTALAQQIAAAIGADAATVTEAATLCKNDLCTRLVFEFPELQGIMGGYYAAASGSSAAVARAIREHYLPTQQGTAIPSSREGQVLALADKLDTLAGIFAVGQKPTASKDPFGLRRAALGALRICIEGKLALDLAPLLRAALVLQPVAQPVNPQDSPLAAELVSFVLERLRAYYDTLPVEMLEALRCLDITAPLDFHRRIQALRDFWSLPDAKNLAAAHKRVRNILKQATDAIPAHIDTALLQDDSERQLATQLGTVTATDYARQLAQLAALRPAVDAFFTAVMVNVDDAAIRCNRLALLQQLDHACRQVADISYLPG